MTQLGEVFLSFYLHGQGFMAATMPISRRPRQSQSASGFPGTLPPAGRSSGSWCMAWDEASN